MRGKLAWAGAVAAFAVALFASSAQGATLKVTKVGDPPPGTCKPKDCSLREAVIRANSTAANDRILLRAKTYRLKIVGEDDLAAAGDLDLAAGMGSLAIAGKGRGKTEIDGGDIDRILEVPLGARLAVRNLTLQNGLTGSDGGAIETHGRVGLKNTTLKGNAAGFGGAIHNIGRLQGTGVRFIRNDALNGGALNNQNEGRASLTRSAFARNRATSNDGGAIRNQNEAVLVIKRSKLSGNSADDDGGAIFNQNEARLTISRSSITANKTLSLGGPASARGGGIFSQNDARLTVVASTISGNRSPSIGGGLFTQNNATTTFKNSTVSGNSAARGGGVYVHNFATVRTLFSTIARNRATESGGAIYEETSDNAGPTLPQPPYLIFRGALIARNAAPAAANCFATNPSFWKSLGGNTEDRKSCQFNRKSDRRKAKPGIGKLRRNGGPTKTHALKRSSGAVNAAKKKGCPRRDQRGVKRPQGKRCDSGAFER